MAPPQARCGDVSLHHWRLGFRQSGLHHIARVSRAPALRTFRPLSLPHHALVPLGFRRKVGWATQKPHSSELLPAARGIDDRVKRRTRPAQSWSRRPVTIPCCACTQTHALAARILPTYTLRNAFSRSPYSISSATVGTWA